MSGLLYWQSVDHSGDIMPARYSSTNGHKHTHVKGVSEPTCVGLARAPGRYHNATIPPSPRITMGSSRRPHIVGENFLMNMSSLSKLFPGSMGANDSASLTRSTPD